MANPRYICSLPSHFILSSSSYPYPFPSHSLTSSPISLSIHFHFPHFPLSLNPFPTFPTLAALSHISTLFPHSLSLTPQSRTIHIHRPYTLCHTFPHIHPYLPLYPRCTLLYPHSNAVLLSHHVPHCLMFHMKHNNNNSYFYFSILYIIYHIILYTYTLHHW